MLNGDWTHRYKCIKPIGEQLIRSFQIGGDVGSSRTASSKWDCPVDQEHFGRPAKPHPTPSYKLEHDSFRGPYVIMCRNVYILKADKSPISSQQDVCLDIADQLPCTCCRDSWLYTWQDNQCGICKPACDDRSLVHHWMFHCGNVSISPHQWIELWWDSKKKNVWVRSSSPVQHVLTPSSSNMAAWSVSPSFTAWRSAVTVSRVSQ